MTDAVRLLTMIDEGNREGLEIVMGLSVPSRRVTSELRALTDTWLQIYNSERPDDSLGRVPPLTFLPRPSSTGQSLFALST
jgi:hypothetical protein